MQSTHKHTHSTVWDVRHALTKILISLFTRSHLHPTIYECTRCCICKDFYALKNERVVAVWCGVVWCGGSRYTANILADLTLVSSGLIPILSSFLLIFWVAPSIHFFALECINIIDRQHINAIAIDKASEMERMAKYFLFGFFCFHFVNGVTFLVDLFVFAYRSLCIILCCIFIVSEIDNFFPTSFSSSSSSAAAGAGAELSQYWEWVRQNWVLHFLCELHKEVKGSNSTIWIGSKS